MKLKLKADHILYGISLANALRLAWAYASADAGGEIVSLPGAFGLLMGLSVSVGTAFIAGKLGSRLTKGRKTLTWLAFLILLTLEPFILAPLTMTHMSPEMSQVLSPGFSWAWAAVLALVPSLVLAGVAVANGGLVEAGAQPAASEGNILLSDPSHRSTKGKSKAATVHCRYEGAGCKRTGSQAAMNAHARSCPFKPTISMPVESRSQKEKSV